MFVELPLFLTVSVHLPHRFSQVDTVRYDHPQSLDIIVSS